MKIAVIGPLGGCGKTAVARALAEDFNFKYCSIDPLEPTELSFETYAAPIVIDCPPSITPSMISALQLADRIVLVLMLPHLISSAYVTALANLVSEQVALSRPGTPIIVLRMSDQKSIFQPNTDERDWYMATMYQSLPNIRLVKAYGSFAGHRVSYDTALAIHNQCKY